MKYSQSDKSLNKFSNFDKRSLFWACIILALVIVAIFLGSRKLQNFDAALVIYLFGCLFALLGVVYRYIVWIRRPPTKRYFLRTLSFLLSGRIFWGIWEVARDFVANILLQRLIYPRAKSRWLAHLLLATGCFIAFSITFPLTFGWIHFSLDSSSGLYPQEPDIYIAHLFGYAVYSFPVESFTAFMIFHILDWCSIAVILGCVFFLRKRLLKIGDIAVQTFEGDILPLILLIIVSVTGLGLSLDYDFMRGFAYEFMAVLHAFAVIVFLIWIPFGKFFHIIQRPAQIGVLLYMREGRRNGMLKCPHTKQEFASKMHIDDLKQVTKELGFNFSKPDGSSYLDYSPEGKRALIAKAHLKQRELSGFFFG